MKKDLYLRAEYKITCYGSTDITVSTCGSLSMTEITNFDEYIEDEDGTVQALRKDLGQIHMSGDQMRKLIGALEIAAPQVEATELKWKKLREVREKEAKAKENKKKADMKARRLKAQDKSKATKKVSTKK